MYTPAHTNQILEKAYELKLRRFDEGLLFLNDARCFQLLSSAATERPDPPCRSWVNNFCKVNDLQLTFSHEMDTNKILSSTRAKIQNFFDEYSSLIQSFPPQLIFGADESMADFTKYTKVASNTGESQPLERTESSSRRSLVLKVAECHVMELLLMNLLFWMEGSGAVDVLMLVRVKSRMTEDCLQVENRVRGYELGALEQKRNLEETESSSRRSLVLKAAECHVMELLLMNLLFRKE
jgi:hypothetical protein